MFKFSNFAGRFNGHPRNSEPAIASVSHGSRNTTIGKTNRREATFGPSTPFGPNTSVRDQAGNPFHDSEMLRSWIPPDLISLHALMREIQTFDNVAGTAIEFFQECWDEIVLTGTTDTKSLQIYQSCFDALGVQSWARDMTSEFLVLGKLCLHLLFDKSKGYWTNAIIHNPDFIEVHPSPVINQPIKVDLVPNQEHIDLVNSKDPRDQAAVRELDEPTRILLAAKRVIPLDPRNTLYLPRKSSAYDTTGCSMFSRILHFIALERPLMLSTILSAKRRAGPVTHIVAGDDKWRPSDEQLAALGQAYLDAEEDAVSSVFTTRPNVQISRAASSLRDDTWKAEDSYQYIFDGKMHGLGINEQVLRGEVDFNGFDSAITFLMDRLRAHRAHLTRETLINCVCIGVARANEFVKRTPAEIAHRVRKSSSKTLLRDRENLDLPEISHSRSLRPSASDQIATLYEKAEEKGLFVGVQDWAKALNIPMENMGERMQEDIRIRATLQKYQTAKAKHEVSNLDGDDAGLGGLLASIPADTIPEGYNEKVFHRIGQLPLWDKEGKCLTLHKGKAYEILLDPAFLQALRVSNTWENVRVYLSSVHSLGPEQLEVFGYILARQSLIQGFGPSRLMINILAEKLENKDLSDPSNLPILQEFTRAINSLRGAKALEEHTLQGLVDRENRIPGPKLLTGV